MKHSKFLKTAILALLLLCTTVNAQDPRKDEQTAKAAGEIPELQEWWSTPQLENPHNDYFIGAGLSFLPNFKDSHNAIALRTANGEIHTWLNRFPGDTENVFTWRAGYIKRGDFNGDGITDYIDANGNIYRGIQNGQPPEPEPVKNYGMNGQVFDVNSDNYDDVCNFQFSGVMVLYGGTDLANLQTNDKYQSPFRNGDNGGINAFYKTPSGEFRIVFHTMKKDSTDGYILYNARWEKGSITPVFEPLDSIIRYLDFQHTSYFDGISGVYQSKHHNKTFLFNNETVYNNTFTKNVVFYEVTDDRFTQSLKFRMDNANFTILEHSVDGDQYEDWYMRSLEKGTLIFSGGINLDSIPKLKTVSFQTGGLTSISDVSGDNISDIAIGSLSFVIVKGKDLISSAVTEKETNVTFEILEPSPSPVTNNRTCKVPVNIAHSGFYTLHLYNIEGREVALLFNDFVNEGYQILPFDIKTNTIVPGNYILRLSNGIQSVERIILVTN